MSNPTEPRTDLVATEGHGGAELPRQVAVPSLDDDFRAVLFCNIPKTRSNLALLIKASQDCDKRALHHIGTEMRVRYAHLAVVPRTDDATGEIRPGPRLALVCDDGLVVVTSSAVAARTINDLRLYCGDGPWEPPIRCRFASKKGSGHEYLILEVLPDEQPPGKKGK